MTPRLELLFGGGNVWPEGAQFEVRFGGCVLGAGSGVDLPLKPAKGAQLWADVRFEFERWWLRDLGCPHGLFFLGERIHDVELRDGDAFELEGVRLQLQLTEPRALRHEALEPRLAEVAADAGLRAVYADWLEEQGAWLRATRDEPSARELGALGADLVRGDLEVRWAQGLPEAVTARSLTGPGRLHWDFVLKQLSRLPAFRLLRDLTLDYTVLDHAGHPLQDIAALARQHFPGLRRLELAPAPEWAMALPPGVELTPWRPAFLSIDGQAVPVASELRVGEGFSIAMVGTHWRALGRHELNGVMVTDGWLRPGDVVRWKGRLCRFLVGAR